MSMQFIMFTKHLEGRSIHEIVEAVKWVGVTGADLCVRSGYPVNPDNIEQALPEAAQIFADEGLNIPLVTAPGDFNHTGTDYADRYYSACGEAGVRHIKIGYWGWSPDLHYWTEVDRVRKVIDGFQVLSEKTGVKTVIHNHSGHSMGLNSSSVMNLVKGYDPAHIGVFSDVGHLSMCGEPIDMALDIVRDYLAVMSFKDLVREPNRKEGKKTWGMDVVRLGTGFGDWETVVRTLKKMNFEGPISMHSEYGGEPVDTVIDLARSDMRYIKRLMDAI
jgi:sugar phosphate isomerase/epimerase